MPTEILRQLQTLREGIAETLKKDPRYLTLAALDKTIAEISGVLSASGLLPAEPPRAAEPLHFEPGGASPSARLASLAPHPPAAAPKPVAPAPVASDPVALEPALSERAELEPEPEQADPEPEPEPAPRVAAAPVKPKKSFVLKPLVETAAVVGAGALAAEIYSEAKGKPMGKSEPKAAASASEDEGDSDEEGEPASAHEAHEPSAEPHHDETPHEEAAEEAEAVTEDHELHASAAEPAHAAALHDEPDEHDAAEDEAGEHEPAGDEAPTHEAAAHEAADHEAAEHESAEQEPAEQESPEQEAGELEPGEHGADDHGADEHGAHEKEDPAGVVPKGKASGYKAMGAKPGAPQYQPAISVRFGKLPNKVDLRSLMTPIEDQGDTNSCVANAVAGAYEYWIKKASKQNQQISRLFVYYNARWRDNSQDKDEGSVIQLAMEGLSKFGACSEKVWPFDTHLVLKKPGADAYQDGAAYRVHDMAQVPTKLESWKQALAEGKPIVFGCELFDSFDECSKRGGVVPMPAPDDIARKKHSGHSMCAVGYSDSEKVFIVRNSWGADWGDKGYCYMPYSYLMSSKFNDGDCWVFVPKVPSQPPREVWSDTTDPVTNSGRGVDFPIETYTIAEYEAVVVDLFEKIRAPFNATIVAGYSEYVSLVGKNMWSELDKFDVATYLASTAALTGVASIVAEAYLSESSTSETDISESSESVSAISEESTSEESTSEESTSEESSEESESSEDTEDSAEDAAEDASDDDADDDATEDAADEDADDDATEDEADEDADGDATEDAADEDADDDATEDTADDDADNDAAEDDDEADTDDDAAEDDDAADDEGADDDSGDDDGGDDGGGDDGGDDE